MGLLLKALRKLRQLDNPLVRDFTEDTQRRMEEIANEVQEDDYDLFSKYVTDPFGRWLDRKGYLEVLVGVDNYQKNVIDCYNYSAGHIRQICEQMRSYDNYFGQSLAGYASQATNVCKLTTELAECLNANSKTYDSRQPISDRIMWYRTHWVKDINGKQCQISDIADDAERRFRQETNRSTTTESEVVEFCTDEDNDTLFKEYNDHVFDEAMDWSALDIVFLSGGSVIYKGVEMTADELLSVLTKEGYSDKIVRKQLNQIIASVISADKTTQTFLKDHDMAKETVESLLSDYMKDEDKNSSFKSFVEAMGGMTAVKELAKSCPELLDYLFTDYEKGLHILDDIANTCDRSGTAEMRSAVELLRQDYAHKWAGLLHKVEDFSSTMINKLSEDGIKDWIKDEIGDTSVIMTVLDIADLEGKTDGAHDLIALRQVADQLQTSYEDAITKIRSGNYEERDVEYAENMFSMLKETTKSVYETYRDMCTDADTKIWCNQQIAKIERIQMNAYTSTLGFED